VRTALPTVLIHPIREPDRRLGASLLLGHVADHGQLEHLSLIGLKDQNQPDHEADQANQWPNHNRGPSEERNMSNERQADPEHGPGDREEETLEGMEADEAPFC
jgi:hypothetical protein